MNIATRTAAAALATAMLASPLALATSASAADSGSAAKAAKAKALTSLSVKERAGDVKVFDSSVAKKVTRSIDLTDVSYKVTKPKSKNATFVADFTVAGKVGSKFDQDFSVIAVTADGNDGFGIFSSGSDVEFLTPGATQPCDKASVTKKGLKGGAVKVTLRAPVSCIDLDGPVRLTTGAVVEREQNALAQDTTKPTKAVKIALAKNKA